MSAAVAARRSARGAGSAVSWPGILFIVVLAIVLAAHAAVVAPEFWLTRLWEDEAYNLTVPLNLLAGHGYSGDGILAPSGTLTAFDPRISTGPVVLLPVAAMLATGIDPVIGARAVMLLFYAALLVGLWFLGRRIGGRWAGLVAVAVPLALNTNQLPSPVQGPIDVLGEIPAAAALVFAFLFVQKRPWLGGLMLGLAVQTKLISGIAAPALLLMVLVAVPARAGEAARWGARIRRAWPLVAAAVAPTVAYELVRLVSLVITQGPSAYLHNTLVYGHFVLTGGQAGYDVAPGEKAASLIDSWFVPAVVVVVLAVLSLLVGVLAVRRMRRVPAVRMLAQAGCRVAPRELVLLVGGVGLTLVLWCGWWLVSAHTPDWIRYAVTGLLLSVPVLAAALVLALRILWAGGESRVGGAGSLGGPSPRVMRPLVILVVVLIAVTWGAQAGLHIAQATRADYGETLADQRAAAASIASLHRPVLVTRWGGQIGAMVLSGARVEAPVAQDSGDTPEVLSNYVPTNAGTTRFAETVQKDCSRVLLRLRHYVVCIPSE